MKIKTVLTVLAIVFLSGVRCPAGTSSELKSARETLLVSSTPAQIILKYSKIVKKTSDPKIIAEYAYVLAFCGLPEVSLYNIDRALILSPLDSEVRFYLSEILNAFGLETASDEIASKVPLWIKKPLILPKLDLSLPGNPFLEGPLLPYQDFEKSFSAIELLMKQKRYAQSAVMFEHLCKIFPDNAKCHQNYAIVLEKLGAYKSAIERARKDMELSRSPEHKKIAVAYISELEKRPPLKYDNPQKGFKGRYLAYLGGILNHSGGQTTYNFNGRIGKFLSDRIDVSLSASLSAENSLADNTALTVGANLRYNTPLKFLPVNGTLGVKVERTPGDEDNLTFLISPGISYFMRQSSIDFFWDIALAGPYQNSSTFSVGYTIYFGGAK